MLPTAANSGCVLPENFYVSYNVTTTPAFDRQAKALAKKYRSLKDDLTTLITQLEMDPHVGVPLGLDCFKIRIAITSKGQGSRAAAELSQMSEL